MLTQEQSVAEAIGRSVRDFPDRPAIDTPDGPLTYAELGAHAERFAARLDALIEPGGFVAIDGTRGPGAIIAMVGSLRAGRPFVVVDPRDSALSTTAKLDRLRVGATGTSTRGPELVELAPAAREADTGTGAAEPGREPLDEIPERIAYAIFTSGSTGEPKCVLVAADALVPVIADHRRLLELGPHSRTLQFARLTFDGCITEILWTLTSGACLVIVDEPALTPGSELRETLERFRVTHLKTTPFALTETIPGPGLRLEHVINGGGTCRQAVVERWAAVARFHNAYGLTETTICNLITGPLDPAACRDGVPLGDPVGDCACELAPLDGDEGPADPERGELVITGRSVAIGYLTGGGVARFREPDGRAAYRTGDVVRRRQGQLYYVERTDRRLKVRGYRIDPGEVEAVACRLESVVESVVTAEAQGNAGPEVETLVCYYTGDADPRALRGHLETHLETYKVPSALVRLDVMPYTRNGKVDRDALRAHRSRQSGNGAAEQERTVGEAVLATVRELTGIEDLRLEDNFFDLGGDSASTVVLVSRLRELGWTDAGVRDVLRAPDLGALADRVPARG